MNSRTQEERNMRRIITGTVLAALIVVPSMAIGQTDEPERSRVSSDQQLQAGPRDHDNDGVPNGQDSDYSGPGKDANKGQSGKDLAQGSGKMNSASQTFVDKNGDGVCDNAQQRAMDGTGTKSRSGQGKGKGAGQGLGRGQGYVDADKDGICDNSQQRKKSSGNGKGGAGKVQ